ncbi:MAG: hypothetical protein QOG76_4928 [Pseudonocardiales bacterium]|jgi:hypothetical protein|nr:hypothetical protein [Pseudonocardiales bacterium]
MVTQAPAANGTHRPVTVANAGQSVDGRGTAGAEKRGAVSGQVETRSPPPAALSSRSPFEQPPVAHRAIGETGIRSRQTSGLDNPLHPIDSGLCSPVCAQVLDLA